MKKQLCMILSTILVIVCLVTVPNNVRADWRSDLYNVPSFKFKNHSNGIGCGYCPVYTAPYEDAYRIGNAGCATNSDMAEDGYINGWLFVRYQTNNGGYRVGYIPPKYARGITSHTPIFDYVPARVENTVLLTDNPMMKGTRFATLYPGQEIYVLAKYTYYQQQGLDWWYIECYVDGQIARGFIDRPSSQLSEIGSNHTTPTPTPTPTPKTGRTPTPKPTRWIPDISPWGTPYMWDVQINGGTDGSRKMVRAQPNTNSKVVSMVYPGRRYPCYASQQGNTHKLWYGIWVEEDNAWGWVSSGFATPVE